MTKAKKLILLFLVGCLCLASAKGQSTIPATGGNSTGSGGSVSLTIGQVIYNTYSDTNGSIAQGVQQPYEISVATAIENTEGITLAYKVYPNPTIGEITLTIKPFDYKKMRYLLIDINGIILQDKRIESEETVIWMENLSPAIYFLKIISDNQEIKVFRIIKN
jgi:hypothetical protein